MKSITMEMVAARAGVSRETVSRVMNNRRLVYPETIDRVLAAAKELGYRFSPRDGRRTLGVVIPRGPLMLNYVVMSFSALRAELYARDYRMELVSHGDIRLLSERVLAGVVDLSHDFTLKGRWKSLRALPVVRYYGPTRHADQVYSILLDGAACFRGLVEYLERRGHRRIGFVSDISEPHERRRTFRYLDGFVEGMREIGMPDPERYCAFMLPGSPDDPDRPLKELLEKGVTALLSTNESFGPELAHRLKRLGLRLPEDISLISHEYHGVSEYLSPAHTTYATDYARMARAAVDLLERIMRGHRPGEDLVLPMDFVERDSVAGIPH